MSSALFDVTIPDIGDASDVEVIEVLVSPRQTVTEGDALITLESDKASMEVPSPKGGEVRSVVVKVGDKVSQGDAVLTLVLSSPLETSATIATGNLAQALPPEATAVEPLPIGNDHTAVATTSQQMIVVPDLGDVAAADVIDVAVKVGDTIALEQPLITLESDKASMEIPATVAGTVIAVQTTVGSQVSCGDPVVTVAVTGTDPVEEMSPSVVDAATKTTDPVKQPLVAVVPSAPSGKVMALPLTPTSSASQSGYASPSVRRLARELGVDLGRVTGTGRKQRITPLDLRAFVKSQLAEVGRGGGVSLPVIPEVDFSKFGSTETVSLNKIKRLTAQNMHRSWVNVPHVTQFDEADITETEAFRQAHKQTGSGAKLTLLAFVIMAVVKTLKQFPQFNASLHSSGEQLILKRYFHIGIAVDTPNGLVVPVIRDADTMSLSGLAQVMASLSQKARDKKLSPQEMSGGSFTISSLGGVGGTAFTPIVNAPEVAILGLSRSQTKPVFDGKQFLPRLMLPLSLSYDHRVIDGAEAARFTRYLAGLLDDPRTILL